MPALSGLHIGLLLVLGSALVACGGSSPNPHSAVASSPTCINPGRELNDFSWSPSGAYISLQLNSMTDARSWVWRVDPVTLDHEVITEVSSGLISDATAVDDDGTVYWTDGNPPRVQIWRSKNGRPELYRTVKDPILKMAWTTRGLVVEVGSWNGNPDADGLVRFPDVTAPVEPLTEVQGELWIGPDGNSWVMTMGSPSHDSIVFTIHASGKDSSVTIDRPYASQGSLAAGGKYLVYYDSSTGVTSARAISGGEVHKLATQPAWDPMVSSRGQLAYLTVFNMQPNQLCVAPAALD